MRGPVDDAVFAALAAGTALVAALGGTAIYYGLAPQGTAFPYVVYSLQAGVDENVSQRRTRRIVYAVKGLTPDAAVSATLDEAIDDALHEAVLLVAGWSNYRTRREQDIEYVEATVGGEAVYHRGGQYGVWVASDGE